MVREYSKFLTAIIGLVFFLCFYIINIDSAPIENIFLSSLLGVISFNVALTNIQKKNAVSPIALLALLFLIHYAISGLFVDIGAWRFYSVINEPYYTNAKIYILGSFALVFASELTKKVRKYKNITLNQNKWEDNKVKITVLILCVISTLAKIYIVEHNSYFQQTRTSSEQFGDTPFYAFLMAFELFSFYSLLILCIHRYSNPALSKKWLDIVITILFISELIYWVPTGRKEPVIDTVLFPFVIKYIYEKKTPSKPTIFLSIIFIYIFFQIATFFRAAMSVIDFSGTQLSIPLLVSTVTENLDKGYDLYSNASKNDEVQISSFQRLSIQEESAAAMRLVEKDGVVYGETYVKILYSIIPRFIWQDKPSYTYGNEFGQRAEMVYKDDYRSSVAPTLLGEGFINFGWLGCIPMILLLKFMNSIYYRIYYSKKNEAFVLVYMIALQSYIYIGADFASLVSGMLKILPFYYIIGLLMYKRKSTYSGN